MGARPNFMKIAPIMREMAQYPAEFEQILVHTGQHYDANMAQVFFDEPEPPKPDVHLGVGSGSHATQTALIMQRFEPVLLDYEPAWAHAYSSGADRFRWRARGDDLPGCFVAVVPRPAWMT